DYVARDQHTRAACEADVAQCDLYIGLFAWRYGYIPEDNNPEGKSITEIEYHKAQHDGKTCLVFLLDDTAPWSPSLMDTESNEQDRGQRIRALRQELKKRCAGYFRSPDDLATQVIAAVYQDEATKRVRTWEALDEIKQSVALGPSYLPNIQEK